MEHPWRQGPIPGNICPTCFTPHFPFCAPHFPVDIHGPSLGDGIDDPRCWGNEHPYLDRGSHGQFQSHPQIGGPPMFIGIHGDGFVGSGDRNYKRLRLDERGVFSNESPHQENLRSFEDERRLRLIRDHGSSGYGHLDDLPGGATLNQPIKVENGFHDPGVFGPSYKAGSFEQQNLQRNTNEYHYSCIENPQHSYNRQPERHLHHSSDVYGPNSSNGAIEQGWRRQDMGWGDKNYSEVPSDSYGVRDGDFDSHPSRRQMLSGSNWAYSERSGSVAAPDLGDFHSPGALMNGGRLPHEANLWPRDSIGHPDYPGMPHYGPPNLKRRGGYSAIPSGSSMGSEKVFQMPTSQGFGLRPPLPTSPPPPLPKFPPGHGSLGMKTSSSPPRSSPSPFPLPCSTSSHVSSLYPLAPEAHTFRQLYFRNNPHHSASAGRLVEETQAMHKTSCKESVGNVQPFVLKQSLSDQPKFIEASHLFRQPHRATRPGHIVIILRGLPGSGKSYLAKMLRDLEVENGSNAPRIHSMDDYFMTEVEKVEETDASKSSISVRGKKPVMKKVMEYCYEPEMEPAYRSSMLEAFRKTLEEGIFTFVIVDDRNLRVADFAQFWAIAKRSGYEVYLLEASYKDPAGCAARNVHGFTQDDIKKMAGQWEEAPSFYLQLDTKSLFHGDDLKESGIQEVDMDVEEEDFDGGLSASLERNAEEITSSSVEDPVPDASLSDGRRWDAEQDQPSEEVKELSRSKWSNDLDEVVSARIKGVKGSSTTLSGLMQAYSKGGKSVQWGDQTSNTGFSIGATKKANSFSLVIGPGAGYNLASNPLTEEENPAASLDESKKHRMFEERLRAERESFKAVFDRKRQRIGLGAEKE